MRLLIIGFLLSGCTTAIKVGDCVRELGNTTVETVTAKSEYGAIETQYKAFYASNPEKFEILMEVYNKQDQEKLVKVECK